MAGIRIGRHTHSETPWMVRPGLELKEIVLEGTDDKGKKRFAVTISSNVCDVVLHNILLEYIPEFTSGAFDLALWSTNE